MKRRGGKKAEPRAEPKAEPNADTVSMEKNKMTTMEELTKHIMGVVSKLLESLDISGLQNNGENNKEACEQPIITTKMAASKASQPGDTMPEPDVKDAGIGALKGELQKYKKKKEASEQPITTKMAASKAEASQQVDITPELDSKDAEIGALKGELQKYKNENIMLRSKVQELEKADGERKKSAKQKEKDRAIKSAERAKNIIVQGIPENDEESMEKTVGSLLETAGCSFDWTKVTKAFRLGRKRRPKPRANNNNKGPSKENRNGDPKPSTSTDSEGGATEENTEANQEPKQNNSRPRGIKIQLQNKAQCREIYTAKEKIATKEEYREIRMRPDSSRDDMMALRTVQQLHTLAKEHPDVESVKMKGKHIEINGTFYRECNLDKIKIDGINPEKASTREFDWGTCFQGHNAPLSNFYKCDIRNKMGNKTFSSAEQYYCSVMANFHDEYDLQRLIEATDNPYAIKAIAKRIWRKPEWHKQCQQILRDIVKAKFDQNPTLKEKLLSYKGDQFKECTMCPTWGAGVYLDKASEAKEEKPSHHNRMGKLVKSIRDAYRRHIKVD
jgi:ribA/ribD-fused uncharacterized protein